MEKDSKLFNLHKFTKKEIDDNIYHTQHWLCRDDTIFPYDKGEINNIIDYYEPKTFIPFLQAMDYPFIAEIWYDLIRRYSTNKNILGRYIAKMRLKGYKPFGFEDSYRFALLFAERIYIAQYRQPQCPGAWG